RRMPMSRDDHLPMTRRDRRERSGSLAARRPDALHDRRIRDAFVERQNTRFVQTANIQYRYVSPAVILLIQSSHTDNLGDSHTSHANPHRHGHRRWRPSSSRRGARRSLDRIAPGARGKRVDLLDLVPKLQRKMYAEGYVKLIAHAP